MEVTGDKSRRHRPGVKISFSLGRQAVLCCEGCRIVTSCRQITDNGKPLYFRRLISYQHTALK